MQIVSSPEEMRRIAQQVRQEGKTIGFVPTMGYLHEGHLSLVQKAKKASDFTVVSLFVNPTQFGPQEDLDRYPRDFHRDRELLEKVSVDLLFAPEKSALYPEGFSTVVRVEGLTDRLCGQSRPWHFGGVTLIVCKLFHLVQPQAAWFGQKDYQQCQVIRRMVRDLDFGIQIHVCPIIRESDGLAMSSRNRYLQPEERKQAPVLVRSLAAANQLFLEGERSAARLVSAIHSTLARSPEARIDYVEVVDAESLEPIETVVNPAVAMIAVYFGQTRLIDNHILGEDLSY